MVQNQFCGKEYPSKALDRHEKIECEERPTDCKFQRIGCIWKGPVHEGIFRIGTYFLFQHKQSNDFYFRFYSSRTRRKLLTSKENWR